MSDSRDVFSEISQVAWPGSDKFRLNELAGGFPVLISKILLKTKFSMNRLTRFASFESSNVGVCPFWKFPKNAYALLSEAALPVVCCT
jgi:hypothetical protein